MGLAVAELYPEAARLLDVASEVTGMDARRVLTRGGPAFARTEVIQPLLAAVTLGVGSVLIEAGHHPTALAGHSAGEVAAWSLAGGCSDEEAVRLAAVRGRAMAEAAPPGGMVAIPAGDGDPDDGPGDDLALAALNPGQRVLSALRTSLPRALALPGARAVATSGPWHGPWMAAACGPLALALAALPSRQLQAPVISNHDATAVDDPTLRRHLVLQLTHPVRWTACLQQLAALHIDTLVLLGPGKHLHHHMRAVLPGARVLRTDDPTHLAQTLETLA